MTIRFSHPTFVAAFLALIAAPPVLAQHMSDAKGVQVSDAWSRAVGKRAHSAVAYLTVANTGDAGDKLVAASSPIAGKVGLHTHIKDGNVMRMRPVQSIEVGPHAKVILQPGGLHLMMTDLKGPLAKGSRFPLTLQFEKAGAVMVEVAVQGPGATGPGKGHGH